MSRAYSKMTCWKCKKRISSNGLAVTNHMRWHVRRGEAKEIPPRFEFGRMTKLDFEWVRP